MVILINVISRTRLPVKFGPAVTETNKVTGRLRGQSITLRSEAGVTRTICAGAFNVTHFLYHKVDNAAVRRN